MSPVLSVGQGFYLNTPKVSFYMTWSFHVPLGGLAILYLYIMNPSHICFREIVSYWEDTFQIVCLTTHSTYKETKAPKGLVTFSESQASKITSLTLNIALLFPISILLLIQPTTHLVNIILHFIF